MYRHVIRALTWPGRGFDQKGTAPSVEQGHCTLIAVKRYRDPPRIGGRHNFLLQPLTICWSPLQRTQNKNHLSSMSFSTNVVRRGAPACSVSTGAYPWLNIAGHEFTSDRPTPSLPCSAEVSSDRTNLSPFTKDYRGLALQCD